MNLIQWIGVILVLDDFTDVGKLDRIHHYMIGLGLLLFGGG